MEHSMKKELLQYFAAKENRTEQEERLYMKMQYSVNSYDICTLDRGDLENYGFTPDVDDSTKERIADEMCGYYLDNGTFSEDLCAAADELRIIRKDEEE